MAFKQPLSIAFAWQSAFSIAFGIMIEFNCYFQEVIVGTYKDKNRTRFAFAQYKNWAEKTKRKMKRGLHIKREVFA